jgi:hypothetical protein
MNHRTTARVDYSRDTGYAAAFRIAGYKAMKEQRSVPWAVLDEHQGRVWVTLWKDHDDGSRFVFATGEHERAPLQDHPWPDSARLRELYSALEYAASTDCEVTVIGVRKPNEDKESKNAIPTYYRHGFRVARRVDGGYSVSTVGIA